MASVKCPPSASCRVPPRGIRAIPARTVREFIGIADRAAEKRANNKKKGPKSQLEKEKEEVEESLFGGSQTIEHGRLCQEEEKKTIPPSSPS